MAIRCDDCDHWVNEPFECSCGKRLCSDCYYDEHYDEHDDSCAQHEPVKP